MQLPLIKMEPSVVHVVKISRLQKNHRKIIQPQITYGYIEKFLQAKYFCGIINLVDRL